MISDHRQPPFETWFELPPEHSLTLADSRRVKRASAILETRWLEELDAQDRLVARFRTWTKQSLKPPYRQQIGWERFSLTGQLLDREIRYSRRDSDDYLH
ncbi:MAG: hypothetical protein HKN42_17465 [Granulosicoccus sp.]|nr:hypothetical protein [Granulosicoccus sp.]